MTMVSLLKFHLKAVEIFISKTHLEKELQQIEEEIENTRIDELKSEMTKETQSNIEKLEQEI